MKIFKNLLLTLSVMMLAAACGNLPEEGQNVTAGNSNGVTDADIQPTLSGPYIGEGSSQDYSYMAQLPTLSAAYDNGTSGHPFLKDYFGKGDANYYSYHNNWFDWTQRDHHHGFMEDNIQVVPSLGGTNATKGSVRFPHSYHQDISKYTDLIGNCTTNCHTRYVDRETKPFQVAPPCNTANNPNAVCTTQTHSKIVFKQKIQVGDSGYNNPAHNFCWSCHANLPTPSRAPHGLIVTNDGVTHQPNGSCSTCHYYPVGDINEPVADSRTKADADIYGIEGARENNFGTKAPLP